MDGDGDIDILFSDRKDSLRGIRWLENPGAARVRDTWKDHMIITSVDEILFIDVGDLDGDGLVDIAAALKQSFVLLKRLDASGRRWSTQHLPLPERVGNGKSLVIGDVDGDGQADLVLSCEGAEPPRSGIVWLKCTGNPFTDTWERHEVSGPLGNKFDHARLIDLDGDGDLDIINSEENNNAQGGNGGLGLVWYENPHRSKR
jgi:hypothetical protein